ncbi:MAG: 4-hydroxy-tetrahydrodipicolinate synthase [Bacillota bacterium]|nr:4-hydroxy-tetrahydrodipicolinate synthase [Bacillota bacterium]MDK2881675.1 4-hydroxy-tetrahydrodipicolinate synthase [Bacillota bacterium]MDK2959874.1 4-hydroxy-tetrahydrodipicolinate synthase [Bacillota bacterium]
MVELGTVITAMVTPFTEDLKVDLKRTAELTEHLIELGSDGLLVTGTTGESPALSTEEKVALWETVIKAARGRVPVMLGTGTNNTEQSIALTKKAEEVGGDAILLVTPYYNKPPQNALYAHFKAVAEATKLPVMIYNVPGRTSRNIDPPTVIRLAQDVPNIVALKEAGGNLDQVSEICRKAPPGFTVYSGDDSLTLPMLSVGAKGVVSVASHLVASQLKEMIASFAAGNWQKARDIHLKYFPLFKGLFFTTSPSPVKAAMKMTGFPVGGLRLPLLPLTEKEEEYLRGILAEVGLI